MKMYDYVPILKLKKGEATALNKLKKQQKSRLLPLFEVVFPGPKKDAKKADKETKLASIIDKFLNKKLPDFPDWLNEACGQYPFILDFSLIYVDSAREKAMEYLLEQCHNNNQKLRLLINTSDTREYRDLVYSYLRKYNFGLSVRVLKTDLIDIAGLNKKLTDILEDSGLKESQIDLLVDIKEESDDENYTRYFEASQNIDSIDQWRTFIFANGAFPESMGGFKSGKEHDIPRTDWLRFNAAYSGENIKRKPIYSDYTTRYPIYDPESEKHSPTPAIKYATDNNWYVMKGMGKDFGYYFAYSLALVSSARFCGVEHCEGDKMLQEKAGKAPKYFAKRAEKKGNKIAADGVGSSEDWISMSISHHLVITLAQLSSRL